MLWAGSSLFATIKLTRPACTCWQALSGDGSRVSKIWWSWLVRRNSSRWYMKDGKQWWLALEKPCTTMPHRPGSKLHLLCFLPFLIQHQDHKMSPSQLPLKLRWALIFQECVLSAVTISVQKHTNPIECSSFLFYSQVWACLWTNAAALSYQHPTYASPNKIRCTTGSPLLYEENIFQ